MSKSGSTVHVWLMTVLKKTTGEMTTEPSSLVCSLALISVRQNQLTFDLKNGTTSSLNLSRQMRKNVMITRII